MSNSNKTILQLVMWPLMIGGLAINILLLKEIILSPSTTGAGSAQGDFGFFYIVAIAAIPVLLVSGILIISIYLMQKRQESYASLMRYGFGLGGVAIFNFIASLTVLILSSG